jgi:hypothetical protein
MDTSKPDYRCNTTGMSGDLHFEVEPTMLSRGRHSDDIESEAGGEIIRQADDSGKAELVVARCLSSINR